jgi:hypothetical protein
MLPTIAISLMLSSAVVCQEERTKQREKGRGKGKKRQR